MRKGFMILEYGSYTKFYPNNPIDGRYVWLPIEWEDSLPTVQFLPKWELNR